MAAKKDDRITVLRVIDRLNVGGPAIHAVLTTKGLDPTRFRTVLVIGSVEPGEASMEYLLSEAGVECIVIPSLGRELRPLRDLSTAWQLLRVMLREKPAIVHTHKAKAGAIGRALAILLRVPVRVHTYHGHVFHGYFSPRKTAMFLGIERVLGRFSSRLIALSARLRDELGDQYTIADKSHFTIVPLGFDLQRFRDVTPFRGQLRRQLGVDGTAKLVGIVGRMVPVKDHATFVAAMAALAERDPTIHMVFIGGGELEEVLKADVAARGLGSRAHFLGWQRDVEKLYADLDVVALSSVNEGTPVAIIEAMAAGIPVVATNVGGVADVLQKGARGELAPAKDPAALADAIGRAFLPAARTRAEKVRDEVHTEFGGARLCADLAHLYDELLAPPILAE